MTAMTFSSHPERTVHQTCPDTCAMMVTVQVGVATQVRGDPAHPTTQGVLCSTVSRTPARTYSADRVLHPRRRVGPKGTPAIVIDPYRSLAAEKSDWHLAPGTWHLVPGTWHLAPQPGTEAALAVGLMQVLIKRKLIDHDCIARHTLGSDALAARAADFPPEKVAAITGLPASDTVRRAESCGAERALAIRVNFGRQRHAVGGNAVRAIACLSALTGAWCEAAQRQHGAAR